MSKYIKMCVADGEESPPLIYKINEEKGTKSTKSNKK